MKKVALLLVVAMLCTMIFAGIALANEPEEPAAPETPVSSEAEQAESKEQNEAVVPEEPVAPDEQITPEELAKEDVTEEDYVGKDIVLEDGEMGITSFDDVKRTLDGEDAYDESIAYTAAPLAENSGRNNYLLYGAGVFVLALVGFAAYRKLQTR
jgi:hypothetical protein